MNEKGINDGDLVLVRQQLTADDGDMIVALVDDEATIKEAAEWASDFLKKEVSSSNISYLIQYGKVHKHRDNGATFVNLDDLRKYYRSYNGWREINWKERLGKDLNWTLSFDHLREKDTTKHVHRLHPYKGKFIPQLVEYFVDEHTDKFKQKVYFRKDDIILDPFMGSGTALVQANELGIHSIGIDISKFNCLIAKSKLQNYDLSYLQETIRKIILVLNSYEKDNKISQFEENLLDELYRVREVFAGKLTNSLSLLIYIVEYR